MFGEKSDVKFKVAIELELTRKSKMKYLEKIGQYLRSQYYDFVVYYFHSEGIMNSYRNHIQERFGPDSDKKILYVLNEKLLSKDFKFAESKVFYKTKEGELNAIF